MKFSEDNSSGNLIRAHTDRRIQINETWYTNSLLVTRDTLDSAWPPRNVADLTLTHFQAMLARTPELVLLGTGQHLCFPDPALLVPLIGQGIGIETMDTPAACRTYNLLVGEGRRVLAALILDRETD